MIETVLLIAGTIAVGIFTNFLWEAARDRLSFISKEYKDIRGIWDVDVDFQTSPPKQYRERIVINHQNSRVFNGLLISPNPADESKELTQIFKGEFVERQFAIYSFKQAEDSFTEFGSGILKIDDSHSRAVGHSVTYGISTQVPTFARVAMSKRGSTFNLIDSLRLRPATQEDLDAIMEMERLGFDVGIQESLDTFKERLMAFPKGCLIAMCDSDIVGCVFTEIWEALDLSKLVQHDFALDHSINKKLKVNGTSLYIVSMTVKPEFRRGGIGSKVFKLTIEKMKEQFPQIKDEILLVNENWKSARRIYRESEFHEVNKFEDFFRASGQAPADAVVMHKESTTYDKAV